MLVALLLLCAVSVGAATATAKEQVGVYVGGEESEEPGKQPKLEAESYPAVLEGDASSTHTFDFGTLDLSCAGTDFVGGTLSEAEPEFPLTPFYYPYCAWTPAGAFTITVNGCNEAVEILNSGPPYAGAFGVECPSATPIRFRAGFPVLGLECIVELLPQSGREVVSLENVGTGNKRAVEIDLEVTGLTYSIIGHPLLCGTSGENGTYSGSITLRGYDE